MVTTAIIVVSGESRLSPLTQVSGLSLLKRAVLTAQKAGATTCYIVLDHDRLDLQRELQHDARVTCRVVWVQSSSGLLPEERPAGICLVFAIDTIFRHPLIHTLSQQTVPENMAVLSDASGAPALALVPSSYVPTILTELAQGLLLRDTTPVKNSDTLQLAVPPGSFLCRLTPDSSLARVEYDILLSLENPRDGFVDRHVNRKFSRPMTRLLLRTPLTPNQITVLAGLASLLGALCFFPGGYYGPLLGALLFQFSAVLDCCDGEIARCKMMESPLGDWLDIVCDTAGAIAIFLGIGIAVWQNGEGAHALRLAGVLVLGGLSAFPLVTLAENTEEAGKRQGGWEDVVIKKLLLSLTNRDFSILILVSAAVGNLSWFLWGAAIGAHVFWLTLAWLLYRAGRLGRLRSIRERKEII